MKSEIQRIIHAQILIDDRNIIIQYFTVWKLNYNNPIIYFSQKETPSAKDNNTI